MAFPGKTTILLDRSISAKGMCHTGNYRLCSAFRELEGTGTMPESVRGFLLRHDYYFHPRHRWGARGSGTPGAQNKRGRAARAPAPRAPFEGGWLSPLPAPGEGPPRLYHG